MEAADYYIYIYIYITILKNSRPWKYEILQYLQYRVVKKSLDPWCLTIERKRKLTFAPSCIKKIWQKYAKSSIYWKKCRDRNYKLMNRNKLNQYLALKYPIRKLGNVTYLKSILLSTTNKMQRYTIFFIVVNALHVSGGFSAHHQGLRNCRHSIWFQLNHANGKQQASLAHTRCCVYSSRVPDDGWRNRPKHVQRWLQ